jgi:hypothetical protein
MQVLDDKNFRGNVIMLPLHNMKIGESTVSLVLTVRRGGCCSRNRETSRKDIPQIFSLSPKKLFPDTGFVGLNLDTLTENGLDPYRIPYIRDLTISYEPKMKIILLAKFLNGFFLMVFFLEEKDFRTF